MGIKVLLMLTVVLLMSGCGSQAKTWELVAQVPSGVGARYVTLTGGDVRVSLHMNSGKLMPVTVSLVSSDPVSSRRAIDMGGFAAGKTYTKNLGALPAARYLVAVYSLSDQPSQVDCVVGVWEEK